MKNRKLLGLFAFAMTASVAMTGCFGEKKEEDVVVEKSTFPEEDAKREAEATPKATATPTVKPTATPAADQKAEDQLDGTEGVPAETTDDADTTETETGNSKGITPSRDNPNNSDTNLTRTIYRNSDGRAIVISADGNGGWVDEFGNEYRFADNEIDVYDQDDVDYYWHGEAADVYYMPVQTEDFADE